MKRIIILLIVLAYIPACAGAQMSAWFLDVGQGDCTVIVCDGAAMIIDGGPKESSQFVYSFVRKELGLDHLEYMISTHPHEDHISGLPAVLNAVPTDLLLSPVREWNTKQFKHMISYASRQGTRIVVPSAGDSLQLGSALVTVLHCWPESVLWREEDVNDMSIVIRIDYGKTSMIVAGDAEETSEYMMIDSGLPLRADVLRVGHHGSTYSTCSEFLSAVSPAYAVISCGAGNTYYHPHGRVLNALKKEGTELFRTDLQGTVRCVSDGERIVFSAQKPAQKEDLFTAPGWIR